MPTKFWLLMGEARSKCQHLAGTPLKPQTAHELSAVTLIKGAMATTAIEGNTLTEDQVRGILDGTYHAPQSREYQEHEVRNVIELLGELDRDVAAGNTPKITSDLICSFNKRLLERTTDDTVHPGVLRSDSVGVGRYAGLRPPMSPTSSTVSASGSIQTNSSTKNPIGSSRRLSSRL